jgi:crotonobetainyl-CoA:carnitine CoA-transferase CaiB-like acyl-CoA transferase
MTTEVLVAMMKEIGVAASKIATIEEVAGDPLVLPKLVKARDERTGFELTLAPPPVPAPFLEANGRRLSFPPRFGEHNEAVFSKELGIPLDELVKLKRAGII